eukprot:1160104-Pelagomonas_calceolata.AAC.14
MQQVTVLQACHMECLWKNKGFIYVCCIHVPSRALSADQLMPYEIRSTQWLVMKATGLPQTSSSPPPYPGIRCLMEGDGMHFCQQLSCTLAPC